MNLKINEIYGPVLQGEGRTLGVPVVFLRLAGCNLHCTWCDTFYTWNYKGTQFDKEHEFGEKVDMKDEVKNMSVEEVATKIRSYGVDRIVISGGEPLVQQKALKELLAECRDIPFEIETNGTIKPDLGDTSLLWFNVSPKLSNSGNKLLLRRRKEALSFHANNFTSDFKFVVSSENDMQEIQEIVKEFDIPKNRIMLMPLGHTKDEQLKNLPVVEKLCLKYNYRLSLRLHILMHGNQRAI